MASDDTPRKDRATRELEELLKPRAHKGDRVYVLEGVLGPEQAEDGFNATVVGDRAHVIKRTLEADDHQLLVALDGAEDSPQLLSTRVIWPEAPELGETDFGEPGAPGK